MSIAPLIARYADRFHRAVGDGHHVASPLGAWLVLALAAPAATGAVRDELTDVLGTSPEAARDAAAALLEHPHPAIASAAAVWRDPSVVAALQSWLSGLPRPVEVGEIPGPAAADRWASEHTLGLIDKFPVEIRPDTILVLASALATRVDWETPFQLVPSAELNSPWSNRVTQALQSVPSHTAYIASSAVGDVAVHAARSADGLEVTSVIAVPDVPAADVLAVAHGSLDRRSLFDLPLGDGPLWTIDESSGRPGERHVAVLPAWSARSEHPLMRPEFGFPAAAQGLIDLLPGRGYSVEAKQSALARFTRTGFEAAAVTGMAMTASLATEGRRRTATLRFGRPYAVVARATTGEWDGVPVFSAWVSAPEEPT
ncbi:MAG TPA: serpin family protein [Jatrophihabitantaceae bacterium]|nr:serpin family protein [Jatrophihabitantaceae bacterium]